MLSRFIIIIIFIFYTLGCTVPKV